MLEKNSSPLPDHLRRRLGQELPRRRNFRFFVPLPQLLACTVAANNLGKLRRRQLVQLLRSLLVWCNKPICLCLLLALACHVQ